LIALDERWCDNDDSEDGEIMHKKMETKYCDALQQPVETDQFGCIIFSEQMLA